ncbi:nucleotidyltransferase family protein [Lysobacter sp. S4-A87]|uniref:nucleotidyltransferase family protein n=1 Tax=Lysobacter sp. S4-A87 TaxID=2925843 RepID=UPI001F52DA70|nr:nucleotidyltransferase family protein [Lysobacter sp. S4-A87]UNK48883.1 nucleotidyltransferase family protein [Lysobacter sp. S4-A87]
MSATEAIVLAGGFGTRLRPVVDQLPKPLAPVAGRPFVAWVLDHLAEQGIERVVMATGYLAEMIEAELGDSWHGMGLAYSVEVEPLGTGGAIALARTKVTGEGVHVVNGDTYLRYSPRAIAELVVATGADMAMALAEVEDVSRYGAVTSAAGRVTAFSEKGQSGPGHINAGCYYLGAATLAALPAGHRFSFENDVLMPGAHDHRVAAYTETSGFIDIGVPEDFHRAQDIFR